MWVITAIKIATVGLAPMVTHYSIGVVVILAALAWAYFMPVFKKTALWVAVTTTIVMTAYTVGVLDEKHHWTLREDAVKEHVEKARSDAERTIERSVPDSMRRDPFNRDR